MKRLLALLLYFSLTASAVGQSFKSQSFLALPDSVSFHGVEWIDVDNDGLLDVAAFAKDLNGVEGVFFFKSDSSAALQFVRYLNTGMSNAVRFITDFDGDNLVDVLVSGQFRGEPQTNAFLNRPGLNFEKALVFRSSAHLIRSADLDENGISEIILSGEENSKAFLRILQHQPGGWIVAHDSIAIDATSVETFDFDLDGDADLFVSGSDNNGMPVSRAYVNEKHLYFKPLDLTPPVAGKTAVSDLNADGALDILLAGRSLAEDRFLRFLNTGSGFAIQDSLVATNDPDIFAADLNSDGICDISLFGTELGGDTLNVIYSTLGRVTVPHSNAVMQAFGDYEHDGDLDLAQLTKTVYGYGLRVLANSTPATNASPELPKNAIAVNIFDRLFMYWDKPSDDRTARNSITYDVAIQSTGKALMVPLFDLINERRLKATRGNNGTANYLLIHASSGPVFFYIQAVDNALHAGIGSVCKGSGGEGSGSCARVETVNVEACQNERITLFGGQSAHWFSFREGFLGDTSVYAFDFEQPDTIFSLSAQQSGCARIQVYTLARTQQETKTIDSTLYVCKGQLLRFGVEPGWDEVEWSTATKGFLSNADTVNFVVTAPDTITVMVSGSADCIIHRNYDLVISKPEVNVPYDAYQILKGQSVRLFVSGGASYVWTPASTLDDAQSQAPLASPSQSTQYSVLVTDSMECSTMARILVIVEETAFIPSLFTPNRDGNNDKLRVYGLTQVKGFSLTIYNREGSKVYEVNSASEAVNNGWNGTSAGVDQPTGVYYWSVKGETSAGKRLLLNGKNSGSVVLVR